MMTWLLGLFMWVFDASGCFVGSIRVCCGRFCLVTRRRATMVIDCFGLVWMGDV